MTIVEMNDQIIVIDAGLGFADEENPGIDYMIPNTRYLEENKHKVKAMLVTHGHLDHIGNSLSYRPYWQSTNLHKRILEHYL